MRKRFALLLPLLPLLVAAATQPATTRPTPPASQPKPAAASQPTDLYRLTPDDFFKLPQASQRIQKIAVDVDFLEAAIFHQTNRQRTANKLPTFQHSFAMTLMARRHSTEMSTLQFFDHTSPTPANRTLVDRLKNVGVTNVTAGENIAVLPAKEMGSGRYITHDPIDGNETWYDEDTGKKIDYYTYQELSEAVATKWKNSPPHWKNIIDPQFKFLGVGVARGPYDEKKQDSFYMTQNFAGALVASAETKAKAALQPKP